MGGVRVDADSTQSTVPGLFAAGEVAGGMHGSNRLGGNSLSDLLVFGRRAGLYAALSAKDFGGLLTVDSGQVDSIACQMLEPFTRSGGENPYAIQAELQDTMQGLVGIIRTESELREALTRIAALKERAGKVRIDGGRVYNPGWHSALDLDTLLTVAECSALAALERRESRGGHTRDAASEAERRELEEFTAWALVRTLTGLFPGQVYEEMGFGPADVGRRSSDSGGIAPPAVPSHCSVSPSSGSGTRRSSGI